MLTVLLSRLYKTARGNKLLASTVKSKLFLGTLPKTSSHQIIEGRWGILKFESKARGVREAGRGEGWGCALLSVFRSWFTAQCTTGQSRGI